LPVHGATSWGWSSLRGRVLARAGIGVLTWVIPPDLVDEAVDDGLAWEMRLRALPSRLGVYFVLGLCLFSHLPYGQVLRELTGGLERALAAAGWQAPASTALTAVRRRIGEKPLESLFRRLCSALSPGRSPWSHVCGLLAVAWDGTTMAAEASAENIAAFGKPGAPERRPARNGTGGDEAEAADDAAGCPQLRLVTLVACGTRALLDAAAGPLRGKGTGEQRLARQLLGSLRAGMLLIADRGFYSYQLWTDAAATGAHLLWRARNDMHLPVLAELPDGSWLTRINDPRAVQARLRKNGTRRRRGSTLPPETGPLPGITARVLEFTLTVTADDGKTRTERYRLLTTLTGWRTHPAAELARAYAWRWAIETGYRECKTYLRGPGRRLRGRTPDLARQELWAYLVIYQAIRAIIVRAAAAAGTDPDRISFTAALHAARRTIPAARDHMDTALASTETEILTTLVPERKGRIYPRAVAKPISPYPSRRTRPGPISQHARYTLTLTTPASTTHTPAGQPRQPSRQLSNPP
jgi:Insertion element 4 transposase N-terminal/Transposase DDE domain